LNEFIVIESGGTKSSWYFSNGQPFYGPGLNPFELSDEKMTQLKIGLKEYSLENYTCHFYGSGCENPKGAEKLKAFLGELGLAFELMNIYTDLLGACRALLGNTPGTVGILGTGAISAVYDGEKVTKTYSGLGALLGDEGSGFDLGKRLLKAYFYDDLNQEISKKIETYFGGKNQIIPTVYGPNGRMKVAGLTRLIGEYRETPIVKAILSNAFEDFYTTALHPIAAEGEVSLVGSIAYHFEKEIKTVLSKKGYAIKKIISSAHNELFLYHKREITF
jgi:glucosamine kinase